MGRGGDQVRLVYGQFDSSSILPCVSGHVVLRFVEMTNASLEEGTGG